MRYGKLDRGIILPTAKTCESHGGWRIKEVTVQVRVPQGSTLKPFQMNVANEGVLRLPYPEGVQVTDFAEDLSVVMVGDNEEKVMRRANS